MCSFLDFIEDRSGAFILALRTVPLRRAKHIDEAIALFEASDKPVFSATSYGFPISFAFRMLESGIWEPVFPDSPMETGNTRSQNLLEAFHPNGAMYVRAIADLAQVELKTPCKDGMPYIMSREESVDIDADVDFKIATALL